MKTTKNPTPSSRRGFLLGAGAAAGTGAAVALGAARQAEPAAPAKPDTKGRGGGYHVTEHVKQYYRTTLV